MNVIGYTAVMKFGPEKGEAWEKYVAWSGLHQLSRVITTDGSLCPSALNEITAEDWAHNLHQDFLIGYFRDLDYLLTRIGDEKNLNILGFVHHPLDSFPHGFTDSHFQFAGYDLVEKGGSISALLNCGGFPESFLIPSSMNRVLFQHLNAPNSSKEICSKTIQTNSTLIAIYGHYGYVTTAGPREPSLRPYRPRG